MSDEKKQTQDGRRVETIERNGIVIETIYDERGRVIEITKWVKPEKRNDPRRGGPVVGREQRPQ